MLYEDKIKISIRILILSLGKSSCPRRYGVKNYKSKVSGLETYLDTCQPFHTAQLKIKVLSIITWFLIYSTCAFTACLRTFFEMTYLHNINFFLFLNFFHLMCRKNWRFLYSTKTHARSLDEMLSLVRIL